MTECEGIQARLPRYAEGEADPAEALEWARHLSRCTCCRILLARERRLLALLDGLEDPVPTDDGFIRRLRQRLPARRPGASRARRQLRLVGLLAGIGAVGYAASQAAGWSGRRFPALWSAPSPSPPESADGLLGGLGAIARLLLGIAARAEFPFLLVPGALELPVGVIAAVLAAATAAACAAAALAGAARGAIRG